MGTRPNGKLIVDLVFFIGLFLISSLSFSDTWSNKVENNFVVDGDHWGIGGRFYLNHDSSKLVVRLKFNSQWSSQYHLVSNNGGEDLEHWARLQHKDFQKGWFFWNSRVEYRRRESKEAIFRFRPRTGIKLPTGERLTLFYELEPHWEYGFDSNKGFFKFAQHFVGFNYDVNHDAMIGMFIEVDTDSDWHTNQAFLGLQLNLKLN